MIDNRYKEKMAGPSKKSLLRRDDYLRIGLLATIIGGIFFIYHYYGVTDIGYDANRTTRSAFFWLSERWKGDWSRTYFAHSHWVPLVSALLIDQKRRWCPVVFSPDAGTQLFW